MRKRIVDWTQRNNGEADTTGWSKSLIANYVAILAVASNESWQKEISKKSFAADSYADSVEEVAVWIFGTLEDSERADLRTFAGDCYSAISKAKSEDYDFNDTVLQEFRRKFRASPVLRSIIVHLGVADFEDSESGVKADADVLFPASLEVNWNRSWFNYRNNKFSDLGNLLRQRAHFSCLEVKTSKSELSFCANGKQLASEVPGNLDERPMSGSKTSSVSDKAPKWGQGQYVIYYGSPGTGKTREANKFIQERIVTQLEIESAGEIRKADLQGVWTDGKRELILSQMRKFVSVCQFHSSYSYEDFIEGLRPLPNADGSVRYEIVDGSFMALWRKAACKGAELKAFAVAGELKQRIEIDSYFVKLYDLDVETDLEVYIPVLNSHLHAKLIAHTNWLELSVTPEEWNALLNVKSFNISVRGASWSTSNQYFLLVDEINRGKVSKIFGELLFAMSATERDKYPEVRTQYSKTPLHLLKNLNIVATMNSCDKSVDVLDQALKRRFELKELMPLGVADLAENAGWKNTVDEFFSKSGGINLAQLLDWLNASLLGSKMVDYDRQIGHSFMFKANTDLRNAAANNPKGIAEKTLALRSIFKVYFADIFPVIQDFFIDRRDLLEEFLPKGFLVDNSFALAPKVRRLVAYSSIVDFPDNHWTDVETDFLKLLKDAQDKKGRRAA